MGHSIRTNQDVEIQFGRTNRHYVTLLYGSLSAEKFNGGMSGTGEHKEYTREEIICAYKKLQYIKGEKDLSNFEDTEKLDRATGFVDSIAKAFFGQSKVTIIDGSASIDKAYEDVNRFYESLLENDFESVIIDFW